jgi:hypothetical protein
MEFEDLQLIWTGQDRQPLYAIDQAALHRRIQAKLNRSRHLASANEIGLVLIFLVTTGILLLLNPFSWLKLLPIATLLGVCGYIVLRRMQRRKKAATFEPTMLGDLDQAIAHQKHLLRESRTFLFWSILPIGVGISAKMIIENKAEAWQWAAILGSFVLSYFVARTAPGKHQRRLRALEALREKLAG